ncbi:MAG: TetM/TetW/TetO/TetS family tetracycline resistance ribosomal protection protein [Terrisporobacter sp.]
MNKIIGILAHVDSGKTSLCEQILYHTNSIRKRGRVDHKDSYFDNNDIERQRGITVFSKEGNFTYKDSTYYLIDTPGHIDFSPEMERSLKMLDYAILVISGVEKVQPHSETIFNLLKENNIPTIIFVNKMDRDIAHEDEVITSLKEDLSENVFNVTEEFNNELSHEFIEFIAERDEELLERFFEDNYDYELWMNKLKTLLHNGTIIPYILGSALYDKNVDVLLEVLHKLTETNYNEEDKFAGSIYKNKYDENNQKLTFIKVQQGTIKIKDEILYLNNKKEIIKDKINEIRIYNGNKYIRKDVAKAGEIVGIKGIEESIVGNYIVSTDNETYLNNTMKNNFNIVPTLITKVIFNDEINIKDVYTYFKILENEDPSLNVFYNEDLKEISISIMGKIQLEILKEIIKDRFNIYIDFGPCEILYKESIKSMTIGVGHFEPLRHYAEVVLKIEPAKRNSNISFESEAHVDDISTGHQNLVKTHIFERPHKGILGGYELSDLKITLLTGKGHNKHTEGGDFRQATYRALRQGLENVKNVLLEPYYKFKIEIENEYIGRVISDIQKMSGEFQLEEGNKDKSIIKGRGPVSKFMDYPLELISFSKGRGKINLIYDGYDECHNSEEVLEKRNYNKDSDNEYTSNSIFCSKGESFSVKGKDIKNYMHCEVHVKYENYLGCRD